MTSLCLITHIPEFFFISFNSEPFRNTYFTGFNHIITPRVCLGPHCGIFSNDGDDGSDSLDNWFTQVFVSRCILTLFPGFWWHFAQPTTWLKMRLPRLNSRLNGRDYLIASVSPSWRLSNVWYNCETLISRISYNCDWSVSCHLDRTQFGSHSVNYVSPAPITLKCLALSVGLSLLQSSKH